MREASPQPEYSDEAAKLRREEVVGEIKDLFMQHPDATEITCDEEAFNATIRGSHNSLLPPKFRVIAVEDDWITDPGEDYRFKVGVSSVEIGQREDREILQLSSDDRLGEHTFDTDGELLDHLRHLKLIPPSGAFEDDIKEPEADNPDMPDPKLNFSRLLCGEADIAPNCPDPTEHRHDKPQEDHRDHPDDPDGPDGPMLV
ncbi:MAG TPA: hypothetical protein VHT70_02275 [Candidatus Saccharimonadales bacterium]|jgi:hypothetical protein|nr:hypothetical protein [Candidatus Saccharimonadales bacterium]